MEDVKQIVSFHNLRYEKPVENPLDGLLLGNGDVGLVVWGGDGETRMRIGKNDVWDARFDNSKDPPFIPLSKFKEAVMEKGWTIDEAYRSKAEKDADRLVFYGSHPPSYEKPYPTPKPCGDIVISHPGLKTCFELNIYDATLRIKSGPFAVNAYVAANDNLIVLNVSCREPDRIKIGLHRWRDTVSPEIPPPRIEVDGRYAFLEQRFPGDEEVEEFSYVIAMSYVGDAKFEVEENTIWLHPQEEESTVYVSIFSSRDGYNPREGAVAIIEKVEELGLGCITNMHLKWWHDFWAQGYIEIDDKELEALWYRSLYYLACNSRRGKQCPALFGNFILFDSAAWHGDYHYNYNIEQTFWAVYSSNRLDLAEPYYRFTLSLLPLAREIARKGWECEGAFYPLVAFPYQKRRSFWLDNLWSRSLCLPAWAAQNFWWHFLFTKDVEFLKLMAYPIIRDVADFYSSLIEKNPKGVNDLYPTVSPEHWGVTKQFRRNKNCTVDIALAKFILRAAIKASQVLGVDLDKTLRWKNTLKRLPPYPTCNTGKGEVFVDVEGAPPITYNIPVPITPVFPGEDEDVFREQRLYKIAKKTVENIRTNGNNSFIMLAVARARLRLKDTYRWIREEALARARKNSTLGINRLKPHNPFNDYGFYTEMYAFPIVINEMLMQSWNGIITLFPCIPHAMKARFHNLRALGGFLVSSSHENGEVGETRILSTVGGVLRVFNHWGKVDVFENGTPIDYLEEGSVIKIRTRPGREYVFKKVKVT